MEIGTQLNNRYTLTARVGQGAMGQVYRALDAQSGQEAALITWSPDGAAVVFMDESGQAWSLKADCAPLPNRGCDQASRTPIKEVPTHWLADFYPQWAGEKVSP